MITAIVIGQRASVLRTNLGLTLAEVASRASLDVADVERFERTGDASVTTLVAIHEALSYEDDLNHLFTVPRFEDISDVIAFEQRRREEVDQTLELQPRRRGDRLRPPQVPDRHWRSRS